MQKLHLRPKQFVLEAIVEDNFDDIGNVTSSVGGSFAVQSQRLDTSIEQLKQQKTIL